ncbi:hypothetical protein ACFSJY_00545 [Thalassotalea euphylliae]|uniref:hypothetical protein n=1 Tax=Thalassotalea euphylliae TaxID=1655234 RepID=UPI003625D3BE
MDFLKKIRLLSVITSMLFLGLVGCSSMSFVGMYKMSQMNPLTTDPAQIKVAIKTDQTIEVKDGSAKINFGYKSDDGTINIEDTFLVQISKNDRGARVLFDDIKATDRITVLSLSEEDAKKFQQNQKIILAHKAQDKEGTGSLGIGLDDFCLPTSLPERDLLIDVYLQTDTKDGYFKFLSGIDIKEQAEKMEEQGEELNCENNVAA